MLIPNRLLQGLDAKDRVETLDWWASLPSQSQIEFAQMWDVRSEDTSLYGTVQDSDVVWYSLPIELWGMPSEMMEQRMERALLWQQLLFYLVGEGSFMLEGVAS